MRKGLEMPLVLVITAVVLIVVSLLIISITSGGLTQFFGQATTQQQEAASGMSSEVSRTLEEIESIKEGGDTGGSSYTPSTSTPETTPSEPTESICETKDLSTSCDEICSCKTCDCGGLFTSECKTSGTINTGQTCGGKAQAELKSAKHS